jgi:hypothetical protein
MQSIKERRPTRAASSRIVISLLMALAIFSLPSSAVAQWMSGARSAPSEPYESDILSARPIRTLLGIVVGGYAWQHLGSFSPNCDCSFSGERGTSPMFGAELSVYYPKIGLAFKLLGTYHDFSAVFTQTGRGWRTVTGDHDSVLIDYERTSDVKLRYLRLAPAVAWYIPYTSAYLQAGVDVGISLKSRYNNVERLLTPGYVYYDSTRVNTLLYDQDIQGTPSLRFDLSVGAGVDIYLSDRFYLTPQVGVTLPLAPVSSRQGKWRITAEYAALIVKIRL